MKQTVYTKSVSRKITQSLFLLLLIIFLSFAFILRATEYLVIQTQTNQVSGYYRAIGTLIPLNTQTDNVAEGAKLLAQNPYVAITDTRRSLSATLDGIYNADLRGVSSDSPYKSFRSGIYVSDILVYGKLLDVKQTLREVIIPVSGGFATTSRATYCLTIQVDKIEAGYPDYVKVGETLKVYYHNLSNEEDKAFSDSLQIDERYFIKAYYNLSLAATEIPYSQHLTLKPLNNQGLWVLPVLMGEAVDFHSPQLLGLLEEIETQNENRRTVRITATKDMSAIPDFQESSETYYLREGRWLNHTDEIDNKRVCVIRDELAKLRGLSIGDTLSLTFRDLKGFYYYGYITNTEFADDVSHWREYPTHSDDFEVVGLYSEYPNGSSYFFNNVYVPFSSAPIEFGKDIAKELRSYEFSFVLKSAQEQEQFITDTKEDLAKLGLQAVFMDNNSSNFWASVKPLKQSAVINLAVFGVVFLLVLTLTVYIYLKSQMKNFAILRALGMPKRLAIMQMMKPMIWFGILGTLIGGSIAWNSALQKSGELLLPMWEAVGIGTVQLLSPVWFVVLSVTVFSLLMVFLLIGMQYIGKKKVLELLQGAAAVAAQKNALKPSLTTNDTALPTPLPLANATPQDTSYAASSIQPSTAQKRFKFLPFARYTLKKIRRLKWKSVLSIAVALTFIIALSWMRQTIQHNETEIKRLYETTIVDATIFKSNASITIKDQYGRKALGVIGDVIAKTLQSSTFVDKLTLESGVWRTFMAMPAKEEHHADTPWYLGMLQSDIVLYGINDPEALIHRFARTSVQANIVYGEGWSKHMFTQEWRREQLTSQSIKVNPSDYTGADPYIKDKKWDYARFVEHPIPVIISEAMARRYRLATNDTFYVFDGSTSGWMNVFVVAGQYTNISLEDTPPILLPISALVALNELSGEETYYSVMDFTIKSDKNHQLPEFRKDIEWTVGGAGVGRMGLTIVFRDEELRMVINPLEKNLQLMRILYPVTMMIAMFIAAGLSILLMFQNAKEAAIMRVLGMPKKLTIYTLCAEQILVTVVGLLLSLFVLTLMQGNMEAALQPETLLCAGIYLAGAIVGSTIGSIWMTAKIPLDLLQVKE